MNGFLTLQEAAKILGKSRPTVWRWCQVGIKGVKLEYVVLGEMRVTEAAIADFGRRLAEAKGYTQRGPRGKAANAVCER